MVFSRVFSAALAVALLSAQGGPASNSRKQGRGAIPGSPVGARQWYSRRTGGSTTLGGPCRLLHTRCRVASTLPLLTAFADDISYNYFAAQAAAERVLDGFLGLDSPTKLRAAFYGYRTKLDLGEQLRQMNGAR